MLISSKLSALERIYSLLAAVKTCFSTKSLIACVGVNNLKFNLTRVHVRLECPDFCLSVPSSPCLLLEFCPPSAGEVGGIPQLSSFVTTSFPFLSALRPNLNGLIFKFVDFFPLPALICS